MAQLSLQHIQKIYDNQVHVVKDFNLEIADKEFIVFVGTGLGRAAAGHRYRSSKDCQSSHGNASVRFFHVNILPNVNKSVVIRNYEGTE